MIDKPILITGVYRSGTTLLSNMLGAHPKINFTYGTVNYLRWVTKPYVKPDQYEDIVLKCGRMVLQRFNKTLDTNTILKEIESFDGAISHAVIYSAIMREYFNNNARWGEKILMEWRNIPLFLNWFPWGKVIHIIRDPRDVAASFKNMTFEPGERYLDSAFACIDSMDAVVEYKATISPNRYLALRYEDLIADKKSLLQQICRFLEEDFSPAMLDEAKYTDQLGNPFDSAAHSSYGKKNGGSVGQGQKKLDPSAIGLIEGVGKDRMEKFHYQCGDEPRWSDVMKVIQNEDLLKLRFSEFVMKNKGTDSFPSDPKNSENWTAVNGSGKDARSKYRRA